MANTANGNANCQNKSWIHFNGVLNKLLRAIKFNSAGIKNNASNKRFLNGISPGSNNNPKITSSIMNLNPSRIAVGIIKKAPINGIKNDNNPAIIAFLKALMNLMIGKASNGIAILITSKIGLNNKPTNLFKSLKSLIQIKFLIKNEARLVMKFQTRLAIKLFSMSNNKTGTVNRLVKNLNPLNNHSGIVNNLCNSPGIKFINPANRCSINEFNNASFINNVGMNDPIVLTTICLINPFNNDNRLFKPLNNNQTPTSNNNCNGIKINNNSGKIGANRPNVNPTNGIKNGANEIKINNVWNALNAA